MGHTEEIYQGLLKRALDKIELYSGSGQQPAQLLQPGRRLPGEDPELLLALLERSNEQTQKLVEEWTAEEIPEALAHHRGQLLAGVAEYIENRLQNYGETAEALQLDFSQLNPHAFEPDPDVVVHDLQLDTTEPLAGLDFDRLHVYGRIGRHRSAIYLCRCACGSWKLARADALTIGKIRSCGCLHRDLMTTHGGTGTRLYTIWQRMKDRCTNQNAGNYHAYGGRGICVCDEWSQSFEAFQEWAMTNGYRDDLTIDRIDNDGDYTPQNCRWATRRVQSQNTRQNVYVMYKGELLTLAEAARRSGIAPQTLGSRRKKNPNATEAELFREPAGRR